MEVPLWMQILQGVIAIAFLLVLVTIGYYATRLLRSERFHNLNPAHKQALKEIVIQFVLAAEQLYGSKAGKEKREWVLTQMQQWADEQKVPINIRLIAAMTEATVLQLINGPSGIRTQEVKAAIQVENSGGDSRSLPFVKGDAPVYEGPPEIRIESN